ncbi:MAG: alpha/beta fold hydrolase [Sphaerochaetaceae bacterium]|nr:alpha/beta fold hydrolase [Sphaerochaetaceae bacterium]
MKKTIFIILSVFTLMFTSCMTSEDQVSFRSEITEQSILIDGGNVMIPAILTLPKGDFKAPVVIMEHGTGSEKNEAGDGYKMLAPSLAKRGIASLRFDFPGSGDSEESYLLYTNAEAVRETQVVADYLSTLNDIDSSRIGLLGWSQGGTDVLLAASNNETYKSVATWAGALELVDMVSAQMREEAMATGQTKMEFGWRDSLDLSKEWIEQAESMDVLAAVENIKAPIGSFHGTLDNTVPFSDSEMVQEKSSNNMSELIPIENADHTFLIFSGDLTVYNELKMKTVEWFVKTL